jgi:hypothetical protein
MILLKTWEWETLRPYSICPFSPGSLSWDDLLSVLDSKRREYYSGNCSCPQAHDEKLRLLLQSTLHTQDFVTHCQTKVKFSIVLKRTDLVFGLPTVLHHRLQDEGHLPVLWVPREIIPDEIIHNAFDSKMLQLFHFLLYTDEIVF